MVQFKISTLLWFTYNNVLWPKGNMTKMLAIFTTKSQYNYK